LSTQGCATFYFSYVEDSVLPILVKDVGSKCETDDTVDTDIARGHVEQDGDTCVITGEALVQAIEYADLEDALSTIDLQGPDTFWDEGGICWRSATDLDMGQAYEKCDFGPYVQAEWRLAGEDDDAWTSDPDFPAAATARLEISYYSGPVATLDDVANGSSPALTFSTSGANFPAGPLTYDHRAFFDAFTSAVDESEENTWSKVSARVEVPMDDIADFSEHEYRIAFAYQMYVGGGVENESLMELFLRGLVRRRAVARGVVRSVPHIDLCGESMETFMNHTFARAVCAVALSATTGCASFDFSYVEDSVLPVLVQDVGSACETDDPVDPGHRPGPRRAARRPVRHHGRRAVRAIAYDDLAESLDTVDSKGTTRIGTMGASAGAPRPTPTWASRTRNAISVPTSRRSGGSSARTRGRRIQTSRTGPPSSWRSATTRVRSRGGSTKTASACRWLWASPRTERTFPREGVGFTHAAFWDPFQDAVGPDEEDLYSAVHAQVEVPMSDIAEFTEHEYRFSFAYQMYVAGSVEHESLLELMFEGLFGGGN
jgi:hypothetical protein